MAKNKPLKNIARNISAASKAVTNVSKAASKAKQSKAKKVSPPPPPPTPTKRTGTQQTSYTLRDLPIKHSKNFFANIHELEQHTDELDKLKSPNEFWAAEIFGNRTYIPYSSMSLLANQLNKYGLREPKHANELLKGIKILKFKGKYKSELGNVHEYQTTKKKEVKKREMEHTEVRKKVAKVVGKKKVGRGVSQIETFNALLDEITKLRTDLEKERKKNAAKKKPVSRPAPKKSTPKKSKTVKAVSKKSSAKKTTPKKSVPKKSAPVKTKSSPSKKKAVKKPAPKKSKKK